MCALFHRPGAFLRDCNFLRDNFVLIVRELEISATLNNYFNKNLDYWVTNCLTYESIKLLA
jgi:hypothetical protein